MLRDNRRWRATARFDTMAAAQEAVQKNFLPSREEKERLNEFDVATKLCIVCEVRGKSEVLKFVDWQDGIRCTLWGYNLAI